MNSPIKITIWNQSATFSDADLLPLCNALQLQISRDFYPAWGVNASIFYTPSSKSPSPGHWVISLLENSDTAGALGLHDLTPDGLPLGKAFVATTKADGGQISVTVSHELVEMLGDPDVNLIAQNNNILYAYETADAVEADALSYGITIPAGWAGAGQTIQVSDFVLPSWFEGFRTTGPFAFKTELTAPFQLSPGGYIGFLDLNNPSAGWQQELADTSPRARIQARPHIGSRRSRRSIPRNQWIRSTYTPGSDCVPAETAHGMLIDSRGTMQKLERAKIVIPVLDLVHIQGTISNLADLRDHLRVDDLSVELRLADHLTNPGATPEQLDALGARITEATKAVQDFDTTVQEPPVTEPAPPAST